MNTIAERVAAGAAFLDEREPGWVDRIDPRRLDIADCSRCVLGQLFGAYVNGLDWMHDVAPHVDQLELGFMFADGSEDAELDDAEGLTTEWLRVILARRKAAPHA